MWGPHVAWLVALDETIATFIALFAGTTRNAAVTDVAQDSTLDVLRNEGMIVVDVQLYAFALPRLLPEGDFDWHQVMSQDVILQRF